MARFKLVILAAHGRECPYCGTIMRVRSKRATKHPDFPTRDHVIPRSVLPGQGTLVVCNKCNSDKGGRTLDQWHLTLRANANPRASIVKALMQNEAWRKHQHLNRGAAEESAQASA